MKRLNLLQPPIGKHQPRMYQLLIAMCVTFLLAGYLVLAQWQQSLASKRDLAAVQNQIANIETQIEVSTQAVSGLPSIASLEAQIAALTLEQQALAGLDVALRSANSSSNRGFADDLTLLAQSAMPGLWLSQVQVAYLAGEKTILLSGSAQNVNLLNTYIQRLSAVSLNSNLNIMQVIENEGVFEFTIATAVEAEQ